MSDLESAELEALVTRKPRVYRDRKDEYIKRCVELENSTRMLQTTNDSLASELAKAEYLLKVEREASAKIGFGTLVKRWWRGGK